MNKLSDYKKRELRAKRMWTLLHKRNKDCAYPKMTWEDLPLSVRQNYREYKTIHLKKKDYPKLRFLIIEKYTKGKNECNCCGEDNLNLLTIDHINNDGKAHRKKVGIGIAFYKWVIFNEYPKDLQKLCMNCNWGKSRFGKCPHLSRKKLSPVSHLTYRYK